MVNQRNRWLTRAQGGSGKKRSFLFSVALLVPVAIITFMNSWNDVLWPLIVIRNEQLMTMPQLVTLFAVGGRAEAQLGVKLASAVLLALPIIIAYAIFQKHFIQSMVSSGLKG